MKLIVDCFGGDHSPSANVNGGLSALADLPDLHLFLTGDENLLKQELDGKKYDANRLEIIHAPEIVGCDEKPTDVIRLKKESSMIKAIRLLRENDDISGMVSTGSTGALVSAAMLRIGRLRGVIRPAFCPVLPTMNGRLVGICDSGANVDITPDYLQQFAILGSVYMHKVYNIEAPRVALLNIGAEAEKGDHLRKAAYSLLSDTPGIRFVGNMESRDLLSGKYDLVVCDGFSGNVLVKTTEGTALELLKKVKADITSGLSNKIGALFLYKTFMREKAFMDYQNYGGSVLLGTSKVIVKGHGSSKAEAVKKCIEQAYRMEAGAYGATVEAALEMISTPETNET